MLGLAVWLTTRLLTGSPDLADPHALDTPQWIDHRVTPGERMISTAVRFGVTPAQLAEWNELPPYHDRLRPGQRLKIEARRLPPPRERIEHVVRRGESWSDIAVAHRVDRRQLQAYNWRTKAPRAGDTLVVWIDPGEPRTVNVQPGPPPPERFDVPAGGLSIGRPQRGRIEHAVALPDSPWYTLGDPERLWGSSHTIETLQRALAAMRHRTGFAGEIVIGAISLEGGRKFAPHRSHQSGRDVDIRLPLRPGLASRNDPHPEAIDWPATWELVRALLDTEQVQFIFLERGLQRRLYEAARWEGASHETLAELIDWVDDRKTAPVRHARGHDGHIHVRIRCGPDEPRCR